MHITTRPDEHGKYREHTVIDGQSHTTFIKREQHSGWCIRIEEGVHDTSVERFQFQVLKGNPFKDCWRLLRWYFSK